MKKNKKIKKNISKQPCKKIYTAVLLKIAFRNGKTVYLNDVQANWKQLLKFLDFKTEITLFYLNLKLTKKLTKQRKNKNADNARGCRALHYLLA